MILIKLNKVCPNCKKTFECQSDSTCWCTNQPKIQRQDLTDEDCFCKECLLEKYKEKLFK